MPPCPTHRLGNIHACSHSRSHSGHNLKIRPHLMPSLGLGLPGYASIVMFPPPL
jgi:hypothetical protein